MASLFTKIVQGEMPCYKVAETDRFLAFLDISPRKKGHTLVIPKQEIDYIFDLDDDSYIALMAFAKKVAKAIEQVVDCKRIAIAVIGLEVPHTHVHLVPLDKMGDLNFERAAVELSSEEFMQLASEISTTFELGNSK